ncbi:hypothetical protein TRIP_B330667 [uncultured Desulfatiglans sp.]|nr:hypothetical protein TRIP_B330667 [uncultured Desulfatiglans sp.]
MKLPWIPSGNGLFGQSRVNLHVCLCGDLQVAAVQALDFLDIGQKSSSPARKPGSTWKSFPDWKLSPTAKSFPDGYGQAVRRRFRQPLDPKSGRETAAGDQAEPAGLGPHAQSRTCREWRIAFIH